MNRTEEIPVKRTLSIVLIAIGVLMTVYFGIVFIVFGSTDNPLLLPFMAEPVLFSIVFLILGILLAALGIWWRRRLGKPGPPH
jgi:membrane protein implicated in regulation of membrane protease activity